MYCKNKYKLVHGKFTLVHGAKKTKNGTASNLGKNKKKITKISYKS